jgi:DNA topoisomerase VI subunit B
MEGEQKVKSRGSARRSELAQSPRRQPRDLLFAIPEPLLYCSLSDLPQRAGVPASTLPRLVVKEFVDNALDAADAAGCPGEVTVTIDAQGNLTVTDQGSGIQDATAERVAYIFSVVRPMLSSKLWCRPTRGCVGNGLRVCIGYLTATQGRLIIETGSLHVELAPDIDGTSRIVSSTPINPRRGLKLTAIAGDTPFTEDDLAWAQDAMELARQSGRPAFTGRPSAHWLDLDRFRKLLKTAEGNPSVRQFLAHLDGCTSSAAQSRIAARFLRRPADSLNADEAAQLLTAAQAATRPPKPMALCPLGREAVVTAGYAIAHGSFTEGRHAPRGIIHFLVECWADAYLPDDQPDSLVASLFMNRTRAVVECTGQVWYARLNLEIGSTDIRHVPVPAGPHYSLTVAITSPMFPMTSDGKAPDCQPFRAALGEAVGKAATKAGRDIAAQMDAAAKQAAIHRQQEQRIAVEIHRIVERQERRERLDRIEAEKAERKALPSIKDVVLELLPGAVEIEAASGLMFNTRRLVYRIRDRVQQRTGKELTQSYFDQLLTAYEAEYGDLHALLIREPRGSFSIPHSHGDATPLGTVNVRKFHRPAWTFDKIIVIEKEDLRLMLEQADWDRRHDAMLMSSKGFDTRATKDLIDKIAGTDEPVRVCAVHDGDAAGTRIQHTLQHATPARGARAIEVINLGLEPWEGIALGLDVEAVPIKQGKGGKPIRRAVGDYVKARTDRAPNRETWDVWLQHSRVELNAFTSAQLIEWLDRKMAEHGMGKLIPPTDILTDQFGELVRERVQDAVEAAIERRLNVALADIEVEQVKATSPIQAEIDRLSAPLLAEIARVTEAERARLAETEAPFQQQKTDVRAEAEAIDREAEVHRTIERMTPEADALRAAIGNTFTRQPAIRWTTALEEIADATEVDGIDIDLGDGDGKAA